MLKVSIQHSIFVSGVLLNEFLCGVDYLLSAGDRLLGNAGRDATHSLGD
jgi:hypothetical protein